MSMSGPQLESFRRGVSAMKALPKTDPRSWAFQAAIHGTDDPTMTSPLFDRCQHGNLHFLPWHRGYLSYFERILRELSGDPSLNLPFWDWATHSVIPEPFRVPASGSNPLYDPTRHLNNGAPLTPNIVGADLTTALGSIPLAGSLGFSGRLERSPHGTAHVQIGGNMSRFETAGLDPIFWLHHGNIDRLWNVWLNQGGGRVNPSDWGPADPPGPYSFAAESGQTVSVPVGDVVSSAHLGYLYEGVPNPVAVSTFSMAQAVPAAGAPPTRVTASSASPDKVEAKPLGYKVERVKLIAMKDARAALTRQVPVRGDPGRVEPRHVVTVEGLSADKPPTGTYEVYLNVPEAEVRNPTARARYYLGSIDFFGKTEASKRKSTHMHQAGGDGFTETFDATPVIARLQGEGRWNPDDLSVTIFPVSTIPPGVDARQIEARAAAGIEAANVKYKRVSLRTATDSDR